MNTTGPENFRHAFEQAAGNPEQLSHWRKTNPDRACIDYATLEKKVLGSEMNGITLLSTNFKKCAINFKLKTNTLEGCSFESCTFAHNVLTDSSLTNCSFYNSTFTLGFDPGHKTSIHTIRNAKLIRCSFAGNFKNVYFEYCTLTNSRFTGAALEHAQFFECAMDEVIFEQVSLNAQTRFERLASTKGMSISRYTMCFLDARDTGGLSVGQRSIMSIKDDVGRLRLAFSGFWFWFHIFAILAFVSPYVVFLLIHYWEALFARESPNSVPLFVALLRYVVSGGIEWRDGWTPRFWPIATASIFALWNVFRFALIWKTKNLEERERVSGLPTNFELCRVRQMLTPRRLLTGSPFQLLTKAYWLSWAPWGWSFIFYCHAVLIWFGTFALVRHIYDFLQVEVPINR